MTCPLFLCSSSLSCPHHPSLAPAEALAYTVDSLNPFLSFFLGKTPPLATLLLPQADEPGWRKHAVICIVSLLIYDHKPEGRLLAQPGLLCFYPHLTPSWWPGLFHWEKEAIRNYFHHLPTPNLPFYLHHNHMCSVTTCALDPVFCWCARLSLTYVSPFASLPVFSLWWIISVRNML